MAMEDIFNSPVLIKLQAFGQKLGANRFVSALQNSMMSMMSVLMVGAISQIVCSIGGPTMLNLYSTDSAIYQILYTPYNFTTNLIALYLVAILGYLYARNMEVKSPIVTAVQCVACFLVVAAPYTTDASGAAALASSYLGATGMFVSFLVAFVVVQVEHFCTVHKVYIKMPDMVPEALQNSFAGIVPCLFSMVLFVAASAGISAATGGAYTLASGFLALLSVPVSALVSLPGMFIIVAFGCLLWCFGIHGYFVVSSFLSPALYGQIAENAALVAAGQASVFAPSLLFNCMATVGGSGCTWPLVLMGLRSKSEQIRAVAKVGLVPGWFKINEPVTFGMPIMYNPILSIPYIIAPLVNMVWFTIGYMTGIITPLWIPMGGNIPIGLAEYLGSLNPMNAVWCYLAIIPTGIVWYPFFKAYEHQLVKQEQEAEAVEAAKA